MVNLTAVQGSTPPYASWTSFWAFIEDLRASGHAPQVIDNSVWGPNRSGALRSQLTVTLRFLGYLDGEEEKRSSTPALDELVTADDPRPVFRRVIEERYAPVIAVGLKNATVKQVDETLLEMGAGTGDTLRKTRVFFINAAEFAGLDLGPYLKKAAGTPPRTGVARRKPARRTPPQTPTRPVGTGTNEFVLDLRSAGQVKVTITAPLWELDESDMQFVLDLRRMVLSYNEAPVGPKPISAAADTND